MSDDVELLTDVELVDLETLVPYANNPKNHPPDQVGKIASSIRHYGFDQPIVIDGAGEIIKGHGRYAAAQKLGLQTVPVLWRDGLSPPQVKAARIADNKTQMASGFDYDTLSTEVEALAEQYDTEDISSLTGFDGADVDDLVNRGGGSIDDLFEGQEDFVPEAERDDVGDESRHGDPAENDDWDENGEYNGEGVPPGEFACPECGHTFEPTLDDMGE